MFCQLKYFIILTILFNLAVSRPTTNSEIIPKPQNISYDSRTLNSTSNYQVTQQKSKRAVPAVAVAIIIAVTKALAVPVATTGGKIAIAAGAVGAAAIAGGTTGGLIAAAIDEDGELCTCGSADGRLTFITLSPYPQKYYSVNILILTIIKML